VRDPLSLPEIVEEYLMRKPCCKKALYRLTGRDIGCTLFKSSSTVNGVFKENKLISTLSRYTPTTLFFFGRIN